MPDGRMLSKTIAHNEQLAEVSMEADYLFARCVPHLDREGRMAGNAKLVKSIACPLRPEITIEGIPELLRELGAAKLIRWYSVDNREVLEFPGFKNHQKGFRFDREAESRFPAHTYKGALDLLRTNSGPTPAEVRTSLSLSEVKVEVEVEVNPPEGARSARHELVVVPGDLGEREAPDKPAGEMPFAGQDWDGRMSGSVVLREWIGLQPVRPSRDDRDRFGRASKRIADSHTTGEIALAFIGMRYLWPWAEPPIGKGQPWNPEDLLRDFAKAVASAGKHPQFKAQRNEKQFNDALAGGGW